jgi:hypothetical protein
MNKFLYACVKEVCRLWAQPRFGTFHQLLIIVELLWLQPVLQVGKRVLVAQSEIRTVRRVVKQLPVEMHQQCSSVSSCMWMRIAMEVHSTICQHSKLCVLNGPTQFFLVFRSTLWSTLGTRSLTHYRWPTTCSSSWTHVRPSLNILHHCLTVPSLITFWT